MIDNLESIKAQIDIVEIISEYLPLRKNGVNYTCCCPFHTEKSGSFVVNPKKQFYHCFGCGAGGDAIKFLQEFKKIDFKEALEEIAQKYNLPIEFTKNNTREQTLNALFEYNKICKENLLKESNKKILQWLLNRGLDLDDIAYFDIGLAPVKTIVNPYLLECGVVYQNGYSPFSNRITFALKNAQHKIVGFSSRTHPYGDFKTSAKYINSKESKVFNKSKILYNFSNAKQKAIEKKEIIIVEGFMDCIALHKMGFKNAVATCGTAFNATHLSQILRLREEIAIKLCFDKDEAGYLATNRAIKMLLSNENLPNVLFMTNKLKDIGEVLEKKEQLEFKEYNGLEFFVRYHLKRAETIAQKNALLQEVKDLINGIQNYYLRSALVNVACGILGIDREFFTQKNTQATLDTSIEASVFKSILLDKDCAYIASEYLNGDEFFYFRDDFLKHKIGEITQKARNLILDSSVLALSYEDFSESLKAFVKEYYTRELNKAKGNHDAKSVILWARKIQEIMLPF